MTLSQCAEVSIFGVYFFQGSHVLKNRCIPKNVRTLLDSFKYIKILFFISVLYIIGPSNHCQPYRLSQRRWKLERFTRSMKSTMKKNCIRSNTRITMPERDIFDAIFLLHRIN